MKRALALTVSTLVLAACADQPGPTAPSGLGAPLLAIVDGHNDPDRSHFFFLAPIRPFSVQPPRTSPFNPRLSPVVEICEWNGTACVRLVSRLTMSTGHLLDRVYVAPTLQEYGVLWRTAPLNLSQDKTYRIHVIVGTEVLGIADIDVVRTIRQLVSVDRDEYVPLLKDFILPIRFRIEEGALCEPGTSCSSASVDLADDVPDVVELPSGDGVTIPPQNAGGQSVATTITVQECEDDIDVDLPTFGRCLSITADPPLDGALDPPALIQVCDVDFDVHTAGLTEAQERLVTLHRQSGETIQALPHADDDCPAPGPIGSAQATGLRGLAQAAWGLMGRGIAAVVEPRALHASAVLLDVGGGGESDFFSDFQFALPARMEPVEGTSGQTAAPGGLVTSPPAVRVTDRNGQPVAGARVTFEITAGGGEIGSTMTTAHSLEDGVARAPFWRLGSAPGPNSVRATGQGIGDAESGPFMPDLPSDYPGADPLPPSVTNPVTVGSSSVHFTATAGTLYGLDPRAPGAKLLRIDLTTGAGTIIGSTGIAALPALAIDPATSILYAGQGGGTPNIFTIDPATAAPTLLGSTGLGFAAVGSLEFGPGGVLYASVNIAGDGGTGADHLATINTATGHATLVGPFGACEGVPEPPVNGAGVCTLEGMEGMAFDGSGTLWGALSARGRSGEPGLYTIDPATGAATFVARIVDAAGASPSGGVVSLEFVGGVLFGGTATALGEAGDGGRLITINPATGAYTTVGSTTDGNSLSALTFP